MLNDMVDNMFSNKQFKLFLMLRNQKFAAKYLEKLWKK